MLDKEKIKENFSKRAPEYEKHAVLQKELADGLFFTVIRYSVKSILDLGCGTGYLAAKLAEHFPLAKVTGIDIAPGMIRVAKELHQRKNLFFVEADAEEMVFPEGAFDLVVSSASLQWMDFEKVVGNVTAVLRPGGIFSFVTFGPQTLKELKKAGFRVNAFLPPEKLKSNMGNKFIKKEFASMILNKKYNSVQELIYYLKETGAQTIDLKQESRINLSGMKKAKSALQATFEVIYGFGIMQP